MFKRKLGNVNTNVNPYFSSHINNQVTVKTVEDITVEHKKLSQPRLIKDITQDRLVKKRIKRRIFKDLLKFWERGFKEESGNQKRLMLDKITTIKKRRIRVISSLSIIMFGMLSILTLLVSSKVKVLTYLPWIGKVFIKAFDLLSNVTLNNLMVGLTYLSLLTLLYLVVIKTYFLETKKMGLNAEQYINKEFSKLSKKYKLQHKELKKHIMKNYKRRKIQVYKIKHLYNPQAVLIKLDQYGNYINEKYSVFSKYYYLLIFFSLILRLGVVGLTSYIIYTFFI